PPTSSATSTPPVVTPEQAVFQAARSDIAACWAAGKKANPELADGKMILNVMVHDGHVTCAVASESAGLTADIEQCVAARVQREPFPGGGTRGAAFPVEF